VFENWLLNVLNYFLPTIAALLTFITARRLSGAGATYSPEELKKVHQRLSLVVGLLAAWLVVQCLPLVYP